MSNRSLRKASLNFSFSKAEQPNQIQMPLYFRMDVCSALTSLARLLCHLSAREQLTLGQLHIFRVHIRQQEANKILKMRCSCNSLVSYCWSQPPAPVQQHSAPHIMKGFQNMSASQGTGREENREMDRNGRKGRATMQCFEKVGWAPV